MEYRKSISKNYKKLTKAEQFHFNEKRLQGDLPAREALINSCLPLVVKIAEKFSVNNKHIDMDDLVQEGNIALINVIHKSQYKIKNPLNLTGYAAKIIGKIKAIDSDDPKTISKQTGISLKTVKKMLSKTYGARKPINSNSVQRQELEVQEVEENPICVANLNDLINENIKEPNRSIFMDFYGLRGSRRKRALEISKERAITIKEVNSILNKTKTNLSKAAKEYKIA